MTISYEMYCSLRDGLIEYLNHTKMLKRYRLTPKKILEYNLVDRSSRANSIYTLWKHGESVEYIANRLIFWKYDSYETVYEDYKYTFQVIMSFDPVKRWEKFKQIYQVEKAKHT